MIKTNLICVAVSMTEGACQSDALHLTIDERTARIIADAETARMKRQLEEAGAIRTEFTRCERVVSGETAAARIRIIPCTLSADFGASYRLISAADAYHCEQDIHELAERYPDEFDAKELALIARDERLCALIEKGLGDTYHEIRNEAVRNAAGILLEELRGKENIA